MLIEALRITKTAPGGKHSSTKQMGVKRLGAFHMSGLRISEMRRQAHSKPDEFCVRKRMKTHQSAALILRGWNAMFCTLIRALVTRFT